MIIKKFLENHPDLRDLEIRKVLYVNTGCSDIYVLQDVSKVFVFQYDCGIFYECNTEKGIVNFDKYFALIPQSDYSEYIVF